MKKASILISLSTALALLLGVTAFAAPSERFPEIIPLPDGFRPEGIASGYGTDFYAGSLANGAIYKGNLRTGEGAILIPGQPGRIAVGLSFDERTGYLFVAGGPTGYGYVYDTRSGEEVGAFLFSGAGSFVNDVVVTESAAFFTDSFQPMLYRVPLSSDGGLPDPSEVQALSLSGDWEQVDGFNANGIDARPDGMALIVINSTSGILYLVEPDSGDASEIDLGGEMMTMGDGILLDGKTLYVVRNRINQIAVIRMAPDLSSGQVTGSITNPAFRVPTTIAEFGSSLYAVNARFDVTPQPYTDYDAVRVSKR
jgi:hypothetical protein